MLDMVHRLREPERMRAKLIDGSSGARRNSPHSPGCFRSRGWRVHHHY